MNKIQRRAYLVMKMKIGSSDKGNRKRTGSQALSLFSSLLPASFVVGRKTLVAAGHVATQNPGGKKICWAEGVEEYFGCCCGKPRPVA